MQIVTPDFKGKNPGHYSAGVISNGMLYVSGQLSLDPDTREPCTGDISAHAINEVYAEFFGEHKPARIVVSTTSLHFGCLVEIEAMAEMHS